MMLQLSIISSVIAMSVATRAYYLWEDDNRTGLDILSEKEYYQLASKIDAYLRAYWLYKDAIDGKYDTCSICLQHIGKIECSKCKQRLCGRCLINLGSFTCPYCRAPRKA
jgi:hypothetical protein